MRVTLCVDSLSRETTGIGRYCWELATRIGAFDDVEQLIFHRGGRAIRDPAILLKDGRHFPRYGPIGRRIAKWALRRSARETLFHGPNYFLPPWIENGVVTIHDLSVLKFPEMHPPERLRQFERLFMSSLRQAKHILTDTNWIKQELISDFGLADDRVTAIPLGVSTAFTPSAADAQSSLLPPDVQANGYGLCVATFEPRKRLVSAISAWSLLPASLRNRYPLVVAGASGWLNEQVDQVIRNAQDEGWLIRLAYVPEVELPALYARARLFLFPSIYEGFGLPPLEAMACGVPVIASTHSCLPEVTQGAAELVDSDDIEGLSLAAAKYLTENSVRRETIAKGLEVAKKYTWERCAADTMAVYREVWHGRS
jgi:alpha-1,3-rhamnosyl/mannosyltransferase